MHLTLYGGARSIAPLQADDFTDWGELTASLEDIVKRYPDCDPSAPKSTQKEHMLCIAPHRLRHGTVRALANVEEVTLLMLDVDECNISSLLEQIDALKTQAFVYTSPSDDPKGDPDKRRCRVMFPVDRPIKVAECRHTRRAMAERLGLGPASGVDGAPDASRMFFIGRLFNTPEREMWVWD